MTHSKLALVVVALFLVVGVTAASWMPGITAFATAPAPAITMRPLLVSYPAAGAAVARAQGVVTSTSASADQAVAAPANTQALIIQIQPGADAESQILEAVYQKVNPAVVQVVNLAQAGSRRGQSLGMLPQGEGSGFLWDSQGHIVTNDHVIAGADKLQVVFADGTEADATLVGTDPGGDIAVVRVDPALVSNLLPVDQGDMSQVKVGELAIALGNPFGFQNTMTKGIVSALGRSIPSQTQYSIPQAIQTDAAINPGNSGGPLLNELGQVIGVNDQIQSSSGSSSGVGFAIPISIVQKIVPALIKSGSYQHAYLGITGDTFSRSWSQALGLSSTARGIYVMDAAAGGPAAQAGLHGGSQNTDVILSVGRRSALYLPNGGDLITAIDGRPLMKMDDLLLYLEEYGIPGQKATLSVLRNGKQLQLSVTLGVRPDQSSLQQQFGGSQEPQA
jgi:S1-C subfamily serine protease